MISAKRAFAAFAVAGLSAAVVLPAQALPPLGQPVPVDEAVEAFKQTQWEPVITALGPEASQQADEGTIESVLQPTRPIMVIFNQKGTNQWAIGVKMGAQFLLQARGTDLTLLPLDSPGYQSASYHVPVQDAPPGSPRPYCAPDDKLDQAVFQAFGAVRIMDGADADGDKVGFYASLKGNRWFLSTAAGPGASCISSTGEGYALNPARAEFIPAWRQNHMKP